MSESTSRMTEPGNSQLIPQLPNGWREGLSILETNNAVDSGELPKRFHPRMALWWEEKRLVPKVQKE